LVVGRLPGKGLAFGASGTGLLGFGDFLALEFLVGNLDLPLFAGEDTFFGGAYLGEVVVNQESPAGCSSCLSIFSVITFHLLVNGAVGKFLKTTIRAVFALSVLSLHK